MELNKLFKSVLEQDRSQIVICDLSHTIVYMNPAAIACYHKRGGAALIGQNLMNCHNPHSREMIERVVAWFGAKKEHNIMHTFYNAEKNKDVYMVALRDEDGTLIGYYEKHEYRDRECEQTYQFTE